MYSYNQLPDEKGSDYLVRLVQGKLNKELDMDWSEIAKLTNIDYSSDNMRKVGYGIKILADLIAQEENDVHKRILSISDLHVPFQLPVTKFEKYVGKADILQLNGDLVDMQSISKFPKAYRVSPMEEIIMCRQYLIELIDYIKPKKVIANYGNHELRLGQYFAKKLDNELQELMPETALDLIFNYGFKHFNKREKSMVEYKPLIEVYEDVNIEYTQNWHCQIGNTIFCHPKAFSSGMMATAKKAMDYFRNENKQFNSLVMAHTHRIGEYIIGNTTIYEQGTCCDTTKNNYHDGDLVNSQKQGFIYLCQDSNGNVLRDKTKLEVIN